MVEQDSIVLRISRNTPISLEQLTFGMMALGAEYERYVKSQHPKAQDHEADLLVQSVSEGSIWIELVGAMVPILQGMDNILIFKAFIEMVAEKFSVLTQPSGRIEDTTTRELADMTRMAETIVGDSKGEAEMFAMEYNAETKEKTVAAKVMWRAKDAETLIDNATAQIREISGSTPNRKDGVLMRLFQTNIGEAAADRASGEKGIIEAITDIPKRLIYASELSGQRIKNAWNEEGRSPYELGFVVDVDVQMVNGKPRAYRILDVREIFPLDEAAD